MFPLNQYSVGFRNTDVLQYCLQLNTEHKLYFVVRKTGQSCQHVRKSSSSGRRRTGAAVVYAML